jgi:hypothetical protein
VRNGPVYLSNSLATRFEPPPARGLSPVINSVSVTKSASVSAILVTAAAKGESVTLTIKGANLSAITAIQFINDEGVAETDISASKLKLQGDGTLPQAKVSVSRQAKPGRRTIRIMTSDGALPPSATNTIEIVP